MKNDDPLARCKRASLAQQARRVAWQLGALVRRCEREAPEVQMRLRIATEALQLLSARIQQELEAQGAPAGEADSNCERI